MPKPNIGEKKADYLDRCMRTNHMVKDFPDADKRRARCEAIWKEHELSGIDLTIPNPSGGETETEFMKRCMGDPHMVDTYDQEQRAAICYRQYRGESVKDKGKEFSFASMANIISDWQMILPIGEFHTAKYGDINFTRELADAIVVNWQNKTLGERQPFIDIDHDQGAANGWIIELKAEDDGVYAKIEWTDLGRMNVEQKRYKYFSAMIGEHQVIETGEVVWPVLKAVSLTNTPVMDNMAAVKLADKGSHGEAKKTTQEGNMDFKELIKAIGELKASLTPEQMTELSEALGIKKEEVKPAETVAMSENAKDKVILDLSERVDTLQTTVTEMKSKEAAKGEDEFIKLALCDPVTSKGKIKPADEQFWRQQYKDNPKGTIAIVDKLPPILDFSTHGSGSGGKEKRTYTEADKKIAKKYNPKFTDEQIDKMLSEE